MPRHRTSCTCCCVEKIDKNDSCVDVVIITKLANNNNNTVVTVTINTSMPEKILKKFVDKNSIVVTVNNTTVIEYHVEKNKALPYADAFQYKPPQYEFPKQLSICSQIGSMTF